MKKKLLIAGLFVQSMALAGNKREPGQSEYINTQYRYSLTYPSGDSVQSEERDPTTGQPVPKPLGEVSSIVVVFPAVSFPTDQGAPQPVIVTNQYSLRINVEPNPHRLSAEKWLERLDGIGERIVQREKFSFHGRSAIQAKVMDMGMRESCIYVADQWLYQICQTELDEFSPADIQEITRHRYKEILQSFRFLK